MELFFLAGLEEGEMGSVRDRKGYRHHIGICSFRMGFRIHKDDRKGTDGCNKIGVPPEIEVTDNKKF